MAPKALVPKCGPQTRSTSIAGKPAGNAHSQALPHTCKIKIYLVAPFKVISVCTLMCEKQYVMHTQFTACQFHSPFLCNLYIQ